MNTLRLTQEQLKEVLDYNKETGVFTWKIAVCKKIKIGDIAGCLHSSGYYYIRYRNILYKAHRLAWLYVYGKFPVDMLDHIDGNPSNNTIQNLRVCSNSENLKNQGISKNNTSGHKGVSWNKQIGKWKAYIRLDGKLKHLGYFILLKDASKAYQKFAETVHGEFYRDTTK